MSSKNDEYLRILEQTPYAVLIFDDFNNVLFANKLADKWFEKPDHFGKIEKSLKVTPQKWQDTKTRVQQGETVSFESKVSSPLIKYANIFSGSATFNGRQALLLFIRDISEQRYLEQELRSEKNLRELILDSIPALVFVKDDENRLISINRAYLEATGLKKEDVLNVDVSALIENNEIAENYWKDDLEVIETGLPKRNIIEPLITDEKRWFITDKIPFRNDVGKVIGVIGFSIDITERKNAEDALIRSERMLRLIFDSSPDGIVISDLNGRFVRTNEAFRRLLGYDFEKTTNMNFRDITPADSTDLEVGFIRQSLHSGADSQTFEKAYLNSENNTVPVAVTCWMLHDENGKPLQMVANVKDLTYQKKAEKLERSLLEKEKEDLEKDLIIKTKQLHFKVTQLVEKNELVNSLIGQLKSLQGQNPKQVSAGIDNIIHDLQNNSHEDFWAQFEATFGQINQSFYENLFRAYPNLTSNERKISAFLRMNFSTKEISNITHQSIRSIEMARSRLRTKLKLDRKENLTKFLSRF